MARPRVVVVGGGFGGLNVARGLKRSPVDVTVVDRANHHLFQPLLYQVATAGLSLPEIAVPIRSVFDGCANIRTLYAEALSVDLAAREVRLSIGIRQPYDYLVLAAGAHTNYFGHEDWRAHSLGLKTAEDAIALRERILRNFELAEATEDPVRRGVLCTSIIIGGGPTGVELAGAISELSRRILLRDFRALRPDMVRVLLIERSPRVLTPFDERLSRAAQRQLSELGVELMLGAGVSNIDAHGVVVDGKHIPAGVVAWTSGVTPVPLAQRMDVRRDAGNRIVVQPDCSIPGHPDAFVIGDMASFVPEGTATALAGLAPVAIQQGKYVAKLIDREARARRPDDVEERGAGPMRPPVRRPFHYLDKGIMATVGRSRAVMQWKWLRWSGLLAWIAWLVVHIYFLVGFRTRFLVLAEWAWIYLRNRRGARIVIEPTTVPSPGEPMAAPARPPAKDRNEAPAATTWRHNTNGRPS